MSDKPARRIRSFVRREGRLTPGQQKAIDDLWPDYGLDYRPAVTNAEELYGNAQPLIVEIGFGNGESLAQQACEDASKNYLGIEVHRPGVGALLRQVQQLELSNVRVSSHDAVEVFKQQLAPGSLAGVQVFFPDPWHKKRHHKRRLIQPEFVQTLAGALQTGGYLHLATDWENYAEHMLEVMNASSEFSNDNAEGGYVPTPVWRAETKFERRGQRLGHGVWDLLYWKR